MDRSGKFTWQDGEVAFAFGKHKGTSLRQVAEEAPDYLEWILGTTDFPPDARELVSKALKRELPAEAESDRAQST